MCEMDVASPLPSVKRAENAGVDVLPTPLRANAEIGDWAAPARGAPHLTLVGELGFCLETKR